MDLTDGRAIPVSGLLRSARALAEMSQRAVAARAGIPRSVIARMETDEHGQHTALRPFVEALNACGFTVTIHADGRKLRPDDDPERDRAHRRYPPHLNPHSVEDSIALIGLGRSYWAVQHMLNPPPRIYHISPEFRESWRSNLTHPWWARFWEDSAHLAPAHHVNPMLARRREREERRQAHIRSWLEKTIRMQPGDVDRDRSTWEPDSGSDDGAADEG